MKNLFVGVDVGGSNTDAVLLEGSGDGQYRVVAAHKAASSGDGVSGAVASVLAGVRADERQRRLAGVFVGTTAFVNAVIERQRLSRVFVLRVTSGACDCIAPLSAMPPDLAALLDGGWADVRGGHEIDRSETAPLDGDAIRRLCAERRITPDSEIAIVSTFACAAPAHELAAERVLRDALGPALSVTLSSAVAGPHFLKRENAAILNAALRPLARRVLADFAAEIARLDLGAVPVFLTAGDGCAVTFADAALSPICTLLSGPTNSMRGAALVARNCFVMDVGGTSTDCGWIDEHGLPRLAHVDVRVGGVLISSRAPDVHCIALGGGTQLSSDGRSLLATSVGARLKQEALVFGGRTPTFTDVAVAAGRCSLGTDAAAARAQLPHAAAVMQSAVEQLEALLAEMKLSGADQPVVLVGGGAALFGDALQLRGASSVVTPPAAPIINAVGAALAHVSATVERSVPVADIESRAAAIDAVKSEAIKLAVDRGAVLESVRVVDLSTQAEPYSSRPALLVFVKVVGDLAPHWTVQRGRAAHLLPLSDAVLLQLQSAKPAPATHLPVSRPTVANASSFFETASAVKTTRKFESDGTWSLDADDVRSIAIGCGVLGTGGGGNTLLSELRALEQLRKGAIRVASVAQFWERTNDDDGVVVMTAFLGSPLVAVERLGSGNELRVSVDAVANGRRLLAVCAIEQGGMNGLEPLLVAAQLGVPALDGDAMGRAFPHVANALTFVDAGRDALVPAMMAGFKGDVVALDDASIVDASSLEDAARVAVMTKFGGVAAISFPPIGRLAPLVHGSLSHAHAIGSAIRSPGTLTPVDSLLSVTGGKLLFTGVVSELMRSHATDFSRGSVTLSGGEERRCVVVFKNEFLLATLDGAVAVTAPDLISIVQAESARPVFIDELSFGQRLCVVVMPCDARYRSGRAAEHVSPAAFGLADLAGEAVSLFATNDAVKQD